MNEPTESQRQAFREWWQKHTTPEHYQGHYTCHRVEQIALQAYCAGGRAGRVEGMTLATEVVHTMNRVGEPTRETPVTAILSARDKLNQTEGS